VVVILIVGSLSLYFGTQYLFKRVIDGYTSATPAPMPKVEMSDEQFATLHQEVTNFNNLVESGTNVVTLVLSGDDINALIQKSPENTVFKDKIFVRIEGDQIKGSVSLPLDDWKIQRLKGRFVNGSASFNLSVTNGLLFVSVKSLDINGQPLPDSFMAPLKQENLAKDMNTDPRHVSRMQRFESIDIKDGKIIIKARPQAPADPVPPDPVKPQDAK
jgi:hypothetical protein